MQLHPDVAGALTAITPLIDAARDGDTDDAGTTAALVVETIFATALPS